MANADDASASASAKPTAPTTEAPKPAPKPAAKAAAPAGRAGAAKPEEVPPTIKMRRRIVWSCVAGFLSANLFMFLRFFFPRVLFEPNTVHNIGYPSDFQLGVNEKYKAAYRIWVVKEPTRLFVIFAKCTHLGCTPDWLPAQNEFHCPCHGSEYTPEGINFGGPAPRPMDRCHVELNAQGQIIADTARLYSWFPGGVDEFNNEGAFLSLV
jgi:cytochrome b6-f complex iron-sulfur subunit